MPNHSIRLGIASFSAKTGVRGLIQRRTGSNRDGFALVAVVWSLGLITLLAAAVMVGARYRTKASSSYASVVVAETTAESAINLGIATALNSTTGQKVKFPLTCKMPGGERVFIDIEEETGKIDLNTTSLTVLARFFTALAGDQSLGTRIATAVIDFRKPKAAENKGAPTNFAAAARFSTIMQLDQIEGISPRIFRVAQRLVTVRSGRSDPDMDSASPSMRRLLGLEQKPVSATRGLPAGGSITIRADVRSSDGSRYIREALISLGENGRPFLVREWRRGNIDSSIMAPSESRESYQGFERSCFRMAEPANS